MEGLTEVVHEFDYKARDAFLDFHYRKERWAVLVCHRRAGKTVATICDLIRRAINAKTLFPFKNNKPQPNNNTKNYK